MFVNLFDLLIKMVFKKSQPTTFMFTQAQIQPEPKNCTRKVSNLGPQGTSRYCCVASTVAPSQTHLDERFFEILVQFDNFQVFCGSFEISKTRDGNSSAIFIPRGFKETGHGNFAFYSSESSGNFEEYICVQILINPGT